MSTQAENLLKLLSEDTEYRKSGKLFPVVSYPENNEWDYSLPTVLPHNEDSKRRVLLDEKTATSRMFDKVPELKKLNWKNTLLAGGFVTAHLRKQTDKYGTDSPKYGDLDFFLYGINSDEAATEKAYEILRHFANGEPFEYLTISTHCISAYFIRESKVKKVQVVLRRYRFPGEILIGFDLPCCAAGFNGQNVIFTPLSAFCISRSINLVDLTRRSTTLETRLEKYFGRAFDLVLPNMDVQKLVGLEDFALDSLSISFAKVRGFKILAYNVLSLSGAQNDYDTSDDDLRVIEIFNVYANGITVAHAKKTDTGYSIGDRNISWTFENVDLDSRPTIPADELLKSLKKLYKEKKSSLNSWFRDNAGSPTNLLAYTGFKYLNASVEELSKIITSNNAYKTVCKLFEEQYLIAKKVIASVVGPSLNWKSVEPGTQMVGSFSPVITDPKVWYDEFYIETPVALPINEKDEEKPSSHVPSSDSEDDQEDEDMEDEEEEEDVDRPNKKTKIGLNSKQSIKRVLKTVKRSMDSKFEYSNEFTDDQLEWYWKIVQEKNADKPLKIMAYEKAILKISEICGKERESKKYTPENWDFAYTMLLVLQPETVIYNHYKARVESVIEILKLM